MELTQEQEDLIRSLLTNYAYAWQSDTTVDCKRVIIEKTDVGKYPYVATAPDKSLKQPVYDWEQVKWVDKQGDTLYDLQKKVQALESAGNASAMLSASTDSEIAQVQQGQKALMQAVQQLTTMVSMQSTPQPSSTSTDKKESEAK